MRDTTGPQGSGSNRNTILKGLWIRKEVFPVWAALIVAGGIVVGKLGRKKGLETDDIYREVARELKHEAEAEAAREAASHTLDSGTDAIGDGAETHYETANTEDKGEHDNG